MKVSFNAINTQFSVLKLQVGAFLELKIRKGDLEEVDPKARGGVCYRQHQGIIRIVSQIKQMLEGHGEDGMVFEQDISEVQKLATGAFEAFGPHKSKNDNSPNKGISMKIPERIVSEMQGKCAGIFSSVQEKISSRLPKIVFSDSESESESDVSPSKKTKTNLMSTVRFHLNQFNDYLSAKAKNEKTRVLVNETRGFLPNSLQVLQNEYRSIQQGMYGPEVKKLLKESDVSLLSGPKLKGLLLLLVILSPKKEKETSEICKEVQGLLHKVEEKRNLQVLIERADKLLNSKKQDSSELIEKHRKEIVNEYLLGKEISSITSSTKFTGLVAAISLYSSEHQKSLGNCPKQEQHREAYKAFMIEANRQIDTALAWMINENVISARKKLQDKESLKLIPECFKECLKIYSTQKDGRDDLDHELIADMKRREEVMISMLIELYVSDEEALFYSLLGRQSIKQTRIVPKLVDELIKVEKISLALQIVNNANIDSSKKDEYYEKIARYPEFSYPNMLEELNKILKNVSDDACRRRIISMHMFTGFDSDDATIVCSLIENTVSTLANRRLNENMRKIINKEFSCFLQIAYDLGFFLSVRSTIMEIQDQILNKGKEAGLFIPILLTPIFYHFEVIEYPIGLLETLQDSRYETNKTAAREILHALVSSAPSLSVISNFFKGELLSVQQENSKIFENLFCKVDLENQLFHRYLQICSKAGFYKEMHSLIQPFEEISKKKDVVFQVAYYILYKEFEDVDGAIRLLELEKEERKEERALAHTSGRYLILSDEVKSRREFGSSNKENAPLAFLFRSSQDSFPRESLEVLDLLLSGEWKSLTNRDKQMKVFLHIKGAEYESKLTLFTHFLDLFNEANIGESAGNKDILDQYDAMIENAIQSSSDEIRKENEDLLRYHILQYILFAGMIEKDFAVKDVEEFVEKIQKVDLKIKARQILTDYFLMHFTKNNNTPPLSEIHLGLLGFMRIAPMSTNKKIDFEALDRLTYQKVISRTERVVKYLIQIRQDADTLKAYYKKLLPLIYSKLSLEDMRFLVDNQLVSTRRPTL